MPTAVAHLWAWFIELSAARGSSGFGPLPIGYGEIDAWARLTMRDPTPAEVTALRRLDGVFLKVMTEALAKK